MQAKEIESEVNPGGCPDLVQPSLTPRSGHVRDTDKRQDGVY